MRSKAELLTILKELEKPAYDGLTEAQAAQKMNKEDQDSYGDAENIDVLRELPAMSNSSYGGAFVWDIVKAASVYSGQNPSALATKDVASRLIFAFETKLPINMGGPSFELLSAAAIQVGFFTQEQLLILKNLGKTQTSCAKILGLGTITPDDVAKARKI